MKKTLLILLFVSIALTFAGCFLPSENVPGITQDPTASSTNETLDITANPNEFEQKPMIAVSLSAVNETESAEDGAVIFNYSYQNMSLIVPDPEVADKVIVDFLNRIDQTAEHAAQILEAAKTDYPVNPNWSPYFCKITYEPVRIDTGILSLAGSYTTYSGGVHPQNSCLSANYDLITGNVLRLSDILTDESAADTLYRYVIEALNRQKDENFLYDGFESTVQERMDYATSGEECWYFSHTGLCIYFSPYEIAPYASGVIIAEIPYAQLTGILNDAYFPAEAESSSGMVLPDTFNEEDLERFTQFSEVVLDNSGNKFLLYTESAVNHIRIETGTLNEDSTQFVPEQTVFAAYSLTPGDAIMVESAATGGMPNLRLSYHTAQRTIRYYIDFDVEFGNPVLVEES